jgi:hypothetical protein
MSDVVKSFEYKGFKVDICLDPEPQNPFREWDNFGKTAFFGRKSYLGQKEQEFSSIGDFQEWMKTEEGKKAVILPVFMYSHSGDTVRTTPYSCQWDSGQLGWIYATEKTILDNFIIKEGETTKDIRERAEKCLIGEIQNLDRALRGEVYGYIIYNKDVPKEVISACYGFYGEIEEIEDEVKLQVDYYAQEYEENMSKAADRLADFVSNVTLKKDGTFQTDMGIKTNLGLYETIKEIIRNG